MRIFRVPFMFLLVIFISHPAFAEEGYFGVNPGLNFYSMIDDGTAKMTEGIENRMLQERGTYGSLMRSNPCGKNAPWIAGLPIDTKLLGEVSDGTYSRLITLARSRNVSLDSNSALALAECIKGSYTDLKDLAGQNQDMLERAGNIGLYTDGDTGNSDYDIIDDIGKINKLIFKEEEKYTGVKNIAGASLKSFLSGNPVSGLFMISNQVTQGTFGTGSLGGSSSTQQQTASGSVNSLSFGNQCSDTGSNQQETSPDNLIDASFLSELSDTLSVGNSASTNGGANYSNKSGDTQNNSPTSSSDFFHSIPCSNILCIKIKMISGGQSLLGGGQNNSIEGIIERHLSIMGPISQGNLAGQKMTNNMYQLNWSSLKFSNIIPKPLIYVAYKPQVTRRDKNLDTKESKDAKLQKAFRCASYTADISSDPNIANTIMGGSYSVTSASTDTNVRNSTKILAPTDPEQKTLDSCMDVALSEGRKSYYQSFSTDITEIAAFTAGVINEINQILETGKRIDTLRVD